MEALVSTAWQWWLVLWPHVLATAILAITIVASAHAILVKRDTRSTIGWVGLIWLSPVFAIAYAVLGVNRIRSRAGQLRAGQLAVIHELRSAVPTPERLAASTGPDHAPLRSLATLVERSDGSTARRWQPDRASHRRRRGLSPHARRDRCRHPQHRHGLLHL